MRLIASRRMDSSPQLREQRGASLIEAITSLALCSLVSTALMTGMLRTFHIMGAARSSRALSSESPPAPLSACRPRGMLLECDRFLGAR